MIAVRGFSERRSKSANSGPSSAFSWLRAPWAMSRRVRSIRAASLASCGSLSGPKTIRATAASTTNSNGPMLNTPISLCLRPTTASAVRAGHQDLPRVTEAVR